MLTSIHLMVLGDSWSALGALDLEESKDSEQHFMSQVENVYFTTYESHYDKFFSNHSNVARHKSPWCSYLFFHFHFSDITNLFPCFAPQMAWLWYFPTILCGDGESNSRQFSCTTSGDLFQDASPTELRQPQHFNFKIRPATGLEQSVSNRLC